MMSELATKYNPAEVEGKWYQYWLDNKLFSSKPDGREPYTVVIPPPNVTGVLHMGHVLNETIQDILVRHARMQGKNACWVPGTDHASIATEAKVVNRLAEQGIKKTDLTREEFLKHAWAWTEEHGGIILKQLRTLGCSCDWDRTAFTMDEKRSESVIKVFCDLYRKGLIYRGVRMVNWDPKALTALSDEEVIYKEEHTKLYYMKYYLAEQEGMDIPAQEGNVIHRDERGYYAVVATTRPETIMGDVAVCINPNDPKNQWLKGKKVIVPMVNRTVPIIEDEYVEIEFGTGCLKVTPAHDVNDYMLGEKYNLESIDVFNPDGTLSPAAGLYIGMDRFDCRKQIARDMQEAGLMEKVEDYDNKIGCSERTGVPIEPRLSMQWFLKMEHLAEIALAPVMNDDIYQGLVHLAPVVVGASHTGLLFARRWICCGRDCRESTGDGTREDRQSSTPPGGFAPGRGCARYMVLQLAMAHLTLRRHQQSRQRRNQVLLPHCRPCDRPGHHILLGGTHDNGRIRI